MSYLTEALESDPFFTQLSSPTRDKLAMCGQLEAHDPGTSLITEGEPADRFFYIREGRVSVETRAPGLGVVTIETLGPGDVVGISWLLPPYRSTFDVRALDLVRLITFDADWLRRECLENHELGYELHRSFAEVMRHRLQATRLQLIDIHSHA